MPEKPDWVLDPTRQRSLLHYPPVQYPNRKGIMEQNTGPIPGNPRTAEIATAIDRAHETLSVLAATPLRLRDLDRHLQTIGDIELALEIEEDEPLGGALLARYIEVNGLRLEQKQRVRNAHYADSVIADAWSEARTTYAARYPNTEPALGEVLVVLQGEPNWDVTEVLLPLVTVAPLVGPASRRRWRFSLLQCPEWFYWLLRSEISEVPVPDGASRYAAAGVPRLGAPVRIADEHEAEIVTSIWDPNPVALYFDVVEAATAARALAH